MMHLKRRALFVGVGLLLAFAAVEAQSYAFARLSIANGNSFLFYQPDIFDITKEQFATENTAGPLGWKTDAARPQSTEHSPTCGSAFGDSMTQGDEVKDDEAWVHLLSELLGCNIRNFGVGGYGLDQTALRYEMTPPSGNFVILGLFIEMLRRDVAASWTFYHGPQRDHLPRYAITKPMFVMDGSELKLLPRPSAPVTSQSIEQHHKQDFYLNTLWTPLAFPYSYAAGRAIVRRLVSENYRNNEFSNQFWEQTHSSHAAALALKILARLREQTRQRNQQLVVVMIPQVEYTLQPTQAYASFMQHLAGQQPGLCIIDTHPALAASASSIGIPALRAPFSHYSPAGNEILAQTVLQGLQRCAISGT